MSVIEWNCASHSEHSDTLLLIPGLVLQMFSVGAYLRQNSFGMRDLF